MEEWFRKDGCDGFNIMPPFLPGGLDDFVDLVIPELQRRGLFRTEYEGKTLRENLGLKRPASRHANGSGAPSRRGRAPPREDRRDQRQKTWARHADDARHRPAGGLLH